MSQTIHRLPHVSGAATPRPPGRRSFPAVPSATSLLQIIISIAVAALLISFAYSTLQMQHDQATPPNYLKDFIPVLMNLGLLVVLGVIRLLSSIGHYDLIPWSLMIAGSFITILAHFENSPGTQTTLSGAGGGLIGLGGGFYLGVSFGQRRLNAKNDELLNQSGTEGDL